MRSDNVHDNVSAYLTTNAGGRGFPVSATSFEVHVELRPAIAKNLRQTIVTTLSVGAAQLAGWIVSVIQARTVPHALDQRARWR